MEHQSSKSEATENELLVWKSRELLLRTRVLQSQLVAARQAKKTTLEISRATDNSIKSTNDDTHHKLCLKHKQILEEKQKKIEQLSSKLNLTKSKLFRRSKGMIRELCDIYPIKEFPDRKGYSICDIHLPSSEYFEGHDETMVSVAVGYVSHLLIILTEILDINLRFQMRYCGSKSLVYCNRRNQFYPLHVESFKSRESVNFMHGMNLLNLNIVQMRTLYGLPTTDPDETLANLHGLKSLILLGDED